MFDGFFFSGGGVGSLWMFIWESCATGTAGRARALFSAETGSWAAMVSCCAGVRTLDSTRNSRFYEDIVNLKPFSGDGQAYVLDIAEGSVDHRVSEAVRHDECALSFSIACNAQIWVM